MKKVFLLIIVFSLLLLANCTPKVAKSTASSKGTPTSHVSTSQVEAAKTKFPDANMEALNEGYTIYYGVCTNCHEAKTITDFSTEELPGIIERMARKSKLASEKKDAVLKYVIGVKLASVKN